MKNQNPETVPISQSSEIKWHDYNYPPLLNLMHFRPSELPEDRKSLIIQLFSVHIAVLINTILNIITCCIEKDIGILYAFLFCFIFNTIVLFLFYRAYIGLCKEKSKLGLFTYLWPFVIIIMITVSIIGLQGFNGFIRVHAQLAYGSRAAGGLGIIISLIYLGLTGLSGYLYFKIFKERSLLTKMLL